MSEHPASVRGGFGIRLHYKGGGSTLNSYSLGDVQAFDTRAEAEEKVESVRVMWAHLESKFGGVTFSHATVEPVERGAWSPSNNDANLLAALPYIERAADSGDTAARTLANAIRAGLSPYAPECVREPR